jgi:hypothetical protein
MGVPGIRTVAKSALRIRDRTNGIRFERIRIGRDELGRADRQKKGQFDRKRGSKSGEEDEKGRPGSIPDGLCVASRDACSSRKENRRYLWQLRTMATMRSRSRGVMAVPEGRQRPVSKRDSETVPPMARAGVVPFRKTDGDFRELLYEKIERTASMTRSTSASVMRE